MPSSNSQTTSIIALSTHQIKINQPPISVEFASFPWINKNYHLFFQSIKSITPINVIDQMPDIFHTK